MSNFAVCTIVSKNYLPYARVLADSFLKHNRGDVFVLLVDRVDGYFKPEDERFRLIDIEELRPFIPDFDAFCFKYNILELNTAVKPYLLEFLLEKHGMKKLVYFDPDILITGNLKDLRKLLDKNSFVLTPHLTAPIEDDATPRELDILIAGTYNLGFLAMSNTENTTTHLRWWQKRLHDRCIVAIEKGLFVDQKWMDLLPGFYEDVHILRDPGYNVAYWNYHCRNVSVDGDEITVNGKPSYFFHFSGFDPENIEPVSKHQNRYTLEKLETMHTLFERYAELVLSAGWKDTRGWPYAFDTFDNGVKIPQAARRLLLEEGTKAKRFGNPFKTTGRNSYFGWLNEPVSADDPGVTRMSVASRSSAIAPTALTLEGAMIALAEKEKQIEALLNSASWKVTAPLRQALKLIKSDAGKK